MSVVIQCYICITDIFSRLDCFYITKTNDRLSKPIIIWHFTDSLLKIYIQINKYDIEHLGDYEYMYLKMPEYLSAGILTWIKVLTVLKYSIQAICRIKMNKKLYTHCSVLVGSRVFLEDNSFRYKRTEVAATFVCVGL